MNFSRALSACALAVAAFGASANVLTFQGVTFTTQTLAANELQLTIDAAGRNGDWSSAVSVDALDLKDIGSLTSGTAGGAGAGWTFTGQQLSALGCDGGTSTNNACFFGSPVALNNSHATPLVFTFTFSGGTQDFSAPHLQVHFLNADGQKQGSLLSETIPVPEPETYALMLAGLGAVGFIARRRKLV